MGQGDLAFDHGRIPGSSSGLKVVGGGSRQHIDRHVSDQGTGEPGTAPACSLYLRSRRDGNEHAVGLIETFVKPDREDLANPDAALADGHALENARGFGSSGP